MKNLTAGILGVIIICVAYAKFGGDEKLFFVLLTGFMAIVYSESKKI